MFETLEFKDLKKRTESKVGYCPSPKSLHRVKIQRFGSDKVKSSAEISSEFSLPIKALSGNLSIEPCEVSNGSVPIVGTLLLAAYRFIQRPKLFQRLFQELSTRYFLARVKCQERLHTEVYPHAFTCSGQDFFDSVICHDIEPKRSDSIPTDLDITDTSRPIAMGVIQDISADEAELLFSRVPFFERQTHRALRKFVSSLKLRRSVFPALFELRGTDTPASLSLFEIIKKLFPSQVQADNHLVRCVTRYPCPMFLDPLEQLRQVRLQAKTPSVFPIDAVISLFQLKKVVMHIAKAVEHIAHAHILRMVAYLIFIDSQRYYQLPVFNPCKVGRQTRHQAVTLCMSANWYKEYNIFDRFCQEKNKKRGGHSPPR